MQDVHREMKAHSEAGFANDIDDLGPKSSPLRIFVKALLRWICKQQ